MKFKQQKKKDEKLKNVRKRKGTKESKREGNKKPKTMRVWKENKIKSSKSAGVGTKMIESEMKRKARTKIKRQ